MISVLWQFRDNLLWFTNNALENCANTEFSFQGANRNLSNFKKPEASTSRRGEPGKLTFQTAFLWVSTMLYFCFFSFLSFFLTLSLPILRLMVMMRFWPHYKGIFGLHVVCLFVCSFDVCFIGCFCKQRKKFCFIFNANRNTPMDVSCSSLQHSWECVVTLTKLKVLQNSYSIDPGTADSERWRVSRANEAGSWSGENPSWNAAFRKGSRKER